MDFKAGFVRGMDRSVVEDIDVHKKGATKKKQVQPYSEKFIMLQKRKHQIREQRQKQASKDPLLSRHLGIQVHAVPPSVSIQKAEELKAPRPSTPGGYNRYAHSESLSASERKETQQNINIDLLKKSVQMERDAHRASRYTQRRVDAVVSAQLVSPRISRYSRETAANYSHPLFCNHSRGSDINLKIDLSAVSPIPLEKLQAMRKHQFSNELCDLGADDPQTHKPLAKRKGRMSIIEASVPDMFRPDGHDQRHHTPNKKSSVSNVSIPAAVLAVSKPWLPVSTRLDAFSNAALITQGDIAPVKSLHAMVNQRAVEVSDRTRRWRPESRVLQNAVSNPTDSVLQVLSKNENDKAHTKQHSYMDSTESFDHRMHEAASEELHAPPPPKSQLDIHASLKYMHPHYLQHMRPQFAPHYLRTSVHAHDDMQLRESAFLKRARAYMRRKAGVNLQQRSRSCDSAQTEVVQPKMQQPDLQMESAAGTPTKRAQDAAEVTTEELFDVSTPAFHAQAETVPLIVATTSSPGLSNSVSDRVQEEVQTSPPPQSNVSSTEKRTSTPPMKSSQTGGRGSPNVQSVIVGGRCVHLAVGESIISAPSAIAAVDSTELVREEDKISPFSPIGSMEVGESELDRISPFSPVEKKTTIAATVTESDKISPFSPVAAGHTAVQIIADSTVTHTSSGAKTIKHGKKKRR